MTIKLRHISHHYPGGGEALRDVNLTVQSGSIHGIMGRSGAGKSTLLRCVNLLIRPEQGEVWLGDQQLNRLAPPALRAARRQMGMVFQSCRLQQARTIYDNIALPLQLGSAVVSPRQQRHQVDEIMALTELTALQSAYPAQLSGGQQQRVAIARALVNRPSVVLCDEATSALDADSTANILALLQRVNERLGVTLLLVTHEIDVIKQLCQKITVMDAGQVVEDGPVRDFFMHPQSNLGQALVHSCATQGLPDYVTDRLQPNVQPGHHPLVELRFYQDSAKQPLVSEIVSRFAVAVNIHAARIETIQGERMGRMVLEMRADEVALQAALTALTEQAVVVEIMGYLRDA